jgi:hypothetical protein
MMGLQRHWWGEGICRYRVLRGGQGTKVAFLGSPEGNMDVGTHHPSC